MCGVNPAGEERSSAFRKHFFSSLAGSLSARLASFFLSISSLLFFFQRRSPPLSTACFALLRPLSCAVERGQCAEHRVGGVSWRESPWPRFEWPAIVAAAAASCERFLLFDLTLFSLLLPALGFFFCSPTDLDLFPLSSSSSSSSSSSIPFSSSGFLPPFHSPATARTPPRPRHRRRHLHRSFPLPRGGGLSVRGRHRRLRRRPPPPPLPPPSRAEELLLLF